MAISSWWDFCLFSVNDHISCRLKTVFDNCVTCFLSINHPLYTSYTYDRTKCTELQHNSIRSDITLENIPYHYTKSFRRISLSFSNTPYTHNFTVTVEIHPQQVFPNPQHPGIVNSRHFEMPHCVRNISMMFFSRLLNSIVSIEWLYIDLYLSPSTLYVWLYPLFYISRRLDKHKRWNRTSSESLQ